MTAGTAVPSAAKLSAGAYVRADLVLEAEPLPAGLLTAEALTAEPLTGESFGLGSGMTLVSRPVAAVKAGHRDPFDDSPVCVSSPVAPGSYRLSSPYGYRIHPIFGTYSMHTGVDYAAPLGTAIHAVTDGTVVYTGPGRLGRSSELVIIEHTVQDTTFYSWYVHMYPEGVFVEPGQWVDAGEVIAEVGNNGNSTGPHLHFEIHTSDAGLGLEKNPVGRSATSLVIGDDPSQVPTEGTEDPTPGPTDEPSPGPTDEPSPGPSETPSPDPTDEPSPGPTDEPSPGPSETPSPDPTDEPSPGPTDEPSPGPSETPSPDPTDEPSPGPSETPSPGPTDEPSPSPSETPSPGPSETPSPDPTDEPYPSPRETPSPDPSETPSPGPTDEPTPGLTEQPSEEPTDAPTEELSEDPAEEPAPEASDEPAREDDERRARTPFPIRAYGTTVDPVPFLASLGLVMVAPTQCTAP